MGLFRKLFGSTVQRPAPAAGSGSPAGGQSLEDAVPVEGVDAEYAWLRVRPCTCGGPWKLSRQFQLPTPHLPPRYLVDVLEMRCPSGHEAKFFFRVDTGSAAYQREQAETRRLMGLDE